VMACGTAAALFVGVRHVQTGTLTLSELLLAMAYLAQLYGPLETITKKVGELQSSLAGFQRAYTLLDEAPEVPEIPHARPIHRAIGAVHFEHVSFAYEGNRPILDEVSLTVQPGMRVGIVGSSGTGKSTLLHLVMRLFDPTGGRILLDGVDLREYRLADLRRQFAVVLQEPVLFSGTIADNILYGRPDGTFDDIVKAAQAAQAHDFIMRLPEEYATQVGNRGAKLSGGERQRISLARAFFRDAPILILDEPTSSVDVETEEEILEALDLLMEGRTTFLITHRLSALRACTVQLAFNGRSLNQLETVPFDLETVHS
jgi:ATP-binding cassette subfamily B protein